MSSVCERTKPEKYFSVGVVHLRRFFRVSRGRKTGSSLLVQTLAPKDDQLTDQVLRDPVWHFTRETFEPYVGGYFEAPGARGKMVTLKLLQVDSYEPPKSSTRTAVATNSFLLLFSADGELPIFSSIHPIKHAALGEFSLFLTRRDGPAGEIYYEAVFNHLR
jgi:hypothetical protein